MGDRLTRRLPLSFSLLVGATPLIKWEFKLKSSPSDGCHGYSHKQIDIRQYTRVLGRTGKDLEMVTRRASEDSLRGTLNMNQTVYQSCPLAH
jgi:hypothetical protein